MQVALLGRTCPSRSRALRGPFAIHGARRLDVRNTGCALPFRRGHRQKDTDGSGLVIRALRCGSHRDVFVARSEKLSRASTGAFGHRALRLWSNRRVDSSAFDARWPQANLYRIFFSQDCLGRTSRGHTVCCAQMVAVHLPAPISLLLSMLTCRDVGMLWLGEWGWGRE